MTTNQENKSTLLSDEKVADVQQPNLKLENKSD